MSDGNTHSLGARLKGSNGVVEVGLPHRNYSVLKQAHINQWEVKRKNKNGPPLFSEGDEYGGLSFRHSPRKRGIQKYKQQRRGASTRGFTSAAQ